MKILRYILIALCAMLLGPSVWAQSDRQFLRNGNKLYRQQNYAKAEVEYRKALSKNPNNSQALYNLGCAMLMQQKDSAAVSFFEKAGKTETAKRRRAACYHNIGVVCQGHQLYAEAIQAYEESLRNNPNDNETRYNLALCKRLLKNQKKNGGGKNNKDKNNKNNKNNKNKQNKDQNKNNKNKDQSKNQPQPKEQMSKDNAEQLLNAAMQEEKATQQRLKQAMQQPRSRRLQKNW